MTDQTIPEPWIQSAPFTGDGPVVRVRVVPGDGTAERVQELMVHNVDGPRPARAFVEAHLAAIFDDPGQTATIVD